MVSVAGYIVFHLIRQILQVLLPLVREGVDDHGHDDVQHAENEGEERAHEDHHGHGVGADHGHGDLAPASEDRGSFRGVYTGRRGAIASHDGLKEQQVGVHHGAGGVETPLATICEPHMAAFRLKTERKP